MAAPGREPGNFLVDAFLQGEGVRRGVPAELRGDLLSVGDRELPLETIFWTSRRAGLLLLFGEEFTAALRAEGRELEELARAIERRSDRSRERHRLLERFAGEVVVCTAGTAVTGTLAGEPVRGLQLAVFTGRALHLLSGGRHLALPWPVSRAWRRRDPGGRAGGEVLVLESAGTRLELRYLFPEEIRAALRVAERPAAGKEGTGGSRSIEMFARGEVARPVPARLPELEVSVDALQRASALAAERVPRDAAARLFTSPHFFELHFQELGEIALGPLMLRKSAAAATDSLARALEIMDARVLRRDAEAAVAAAAERLADAYGREAERLAGDRFLGTADGPSPLLDEAERAALRERMQRPVARLASLFDRLEACQETLRRRLEAFESGPPEGEERGLERAAAEWRSALQRLDRAYGAAWRELLEEVVGLWSEVLVPRLEGVLALPRRRGADRVRLAVVAAGLLLVAAALLVLL